MFTPSTKADVGQHGPCGSWTPAVCHPQKQRRLTRTRSGVLHAADENIHPDRGAHAHIPEVVIHAPKLTRRSRSRGLWGTAAEIIGKANADRVAAASIALYEKVRTATGMARDARSHAGLTCERVGNVRTQARDFALTKGIIIADTKFEFGLNEAGEVILADEVLTPGTATRPCDKGLCPCANWCFHVPAHTYAHATDSSRFWPADSYKIGASQNRYEGDRRRAGRPLRLKADGWRRAPPSSSFDKQYVRDYLLSINFDKKHGVALPDDVIANTLQKYRDVYRILTGKDAIL